jgi:hypothetical protein
MQPTIHRVLLLLLLFIHFCYITSHLRVGMYETDSVLVDGDEQHLRIVRICSLLDLEEGGPERGPPVDDLQKCNFGVFGAHPGILIVGCHYGPLPVVSALHLDQICRYQLPQHLPETKKTVFESSQSVHTYGIACNSCLLSPKRTR